MTPKQQPLAKRKMPTAQNASKCHYNTRNGWWKVEGGRKEGGGQRRVVGGGRERERERERERDQRDRLVHPVIRLEMALLATSGAFGGSFRVGRVVGGGRPVTGSGPADQYQRTRVKHGNGHGGAVGGG